jgi:DNA-binding transcriptional LysR family regulator
MAAVKHMNFTIAATHLFVTQSVLSKHIASLEMELGVPLFKRNAKSMELTDSGRIFARYVEKMIEIYDEALMEMRDSKKDDDNLSLGMLEEQNVDTQIHKCVVKICNVRGNCRAQFKYYPADSLVEALINKEVDIIITAESLIGPIPNNLNTHLIREGKTHMLMSRSHPLAGRESLFLADVKDDIFIILDPEKYPLLAKLQLWMSAKRGLPNRQLIAPNFETMALWVEMNIGIAIASAWDPMTKNTELRSIELKDAKNIREVIVWRNNNPNPLIDAFRQEIGSIAIS